MSRQRPFYPAHLRVIAEDFSRAPYLRSRDLGKYTGGFDRTRDTSVHLEAAVRWLCRAQDVPGDRGVSTAYTFAAGWMASYPETTGYIVPTLFDYAEHSGLEEYRSRAVEMADWLVSIQLGDGSFQAGPVDVDPQPSVFNTGQILLGLVRAFAETGGEHYRESANRAGDWLAQVQDPDGAWRQFAYYGIPHVYYTRVSWALLELFSLTGRDPHGEAALAQLAWALGQQADNGWFRNNSFDGASNPFTHNIVYAAEGFLGAGVAANRPEYIRAAEKVAAALFRKFEVEKFLPGDLDEDWTSGAGYSCLTGNAQLSGLLLNLYGMNDDERYLNTALKLNEYLKSGQRLTGGNTGIEGGIRGSDPVWGSYLPYSYPNWAVKFFVDALLLEHRAVTDLGSDGR